MRCLHCHAVEARAASCYQNTPASDCVESANEDPVRYSLSESTHYEPDSADEQSDAMSVSRWAPNDVKRHRFSRCQKW